MFQVEHTINGASFNFKYCKQWYWGRGESALDFSKHEFHVYREIAVFYILKKKFEKLARRKFFMLG